MKKVSTNTKLLTILAASSLIFWILVFTYSFFYLNDQLFVILHDDPMISMRYAKHWADGYGIYWNKSGSPEGYTNFLLVSIMAFIHLFNPSVETASLYIILFNYIINILVILITFKASNEIFKNENYALIASFLIGLSFQFLIWGKAGFETSMLALFSIGAIYCILSKRYIRASLIMALAVLARDDFSILVFAFGVVFPLFAFKDRNSQFTTSIKLSAIPLLIFSIHLLWRNYYYGDFLPNTYYLKATGWVYSVKIQEGLKYLFGLLPIIVLSLFAFYRMYVVETNKDKKALFVTLFSSILLYSFYISNVGGDAFAGARLFATVFPIFAVAGTFLIKQYSHSTISVVLIAMIYIFYPLNRGLLQQGYSHIRPLMQMNGFPIHYTLSSDTYKNVRKVLPHADVINIHSCQLIQQHAKQDNIINPSMAVYYAGIPPYMCNEFKTIDLLGKSDRYIARTKTHEGKVGHNKYDYDYSIGKFKPTYILSLMPSISSLGDAEYLNRPISNFNWQFILKSKEFTEHYLTHYIRANYQPIFIRDRPEKN